MTAINMRWGITLLLAAWCSCIQSAGPCISLERNTIRRPAVTEGVDRELTAVFPFKNTGGKPLRVYSVKPECHCTAVEFDTLIKPGRSGAIKVRMDLSTSRGGPLLALLTVQSNSTVNSSVLLTVESELKAYVELREADIAFGMPSPGPRTLSLASKKRDLQVTRVAYTSTAVNTAAAGKGETILPFAWKALDSTRADGYRMYALTIQPPPAVSTDFGSLVIRTNHPGRPEFSLRASIIQP